MYLKSTRKTLGQSLKCVSKFLLKTTEHVQCCSCVFIVDFEAKYMVYFLERSFTIRFANTKL